MKTILTLVVIFFAANPSFANTPSSIFGSDENFKMAPSAVEQFKSHVTDEEVFQIQEAAMAVVDLNYQTCVNKCIKANNDRNPWHDPFSHPGVVLCIQALCGR
jgi:hypothetical protein